MLGEGKVMFRRSGTEYGLFPMPSFPVLQGAQSGIKAAGGTGGPLACSRFRSNAARGHYAAS